MLEEEIRQKIDSLREEYYTASDERKKAIHKEAKALHRNLPHRPGYCHECNMKKALPQEDPEWPFCSKVCHDEYAAREYPVEGKKKGERKTIEQMKRGLLKMAKEEHLKKITGKQQKLI